MIEVIEEKAREPRELNEHELRRDLRAACTAVGLGADRAKMRELLAEAQRRKEEQ